MEKKNKVYGVIGIKAIMSNWNADFTGRPKAISTTQIFGSDKALKYPMKKMWDEEGKKVIYLKSYKIDEKTGEKIQPLDLDERYEKVFGEAIEKKTKPEKVLRNLFSAIDIMNFGATFATKNANLSITGAVQIGQGFNKYDDSNVETQDILSPFRNSNKEGAEASTLGTKIVADECHYIYPFSVNPQNYKNYKDILPEFEGYTEEAYQEFKRASLVSATAINTNSKSGCENEFAIFIESKEDSDLYLANLNQYITFEKIENGKDIINIETLKEVIKENQDKIQKIEIYYNKITTQINTDGIECETYDIFEKIR